MGYGLLGKCNNCGYQVNLRYGPTMRMHNEPFPVPALDCSRNIIVSAKYHEKHIASKRYTFYTERKLKSFFGGSKLQCYDLFLNENNNYCPKCDKKKLSFETTMLID